MILVLLVKRHHELEVAESYKDLRNIEWNFTFGRFNIKPLFRCELEKQVNDVAQDDNEDEDHAEDDRLELYFLVHFLEVLYHELYHYDEEWNECQNCDTILDC